MEDKEVGDFEASSEDWTEEEIEEMQNSNAPKITGIMLSIFVGIVIVMVGGLAAYYYYNFQTQGSNYEKRLQEDWDEVIISTNELSNDFSNIVSFDEFTSNTKGSFQETVNDSNRVLKDISYDLQSISGYPISGSLVISKMRGVVERYLDFLRELQSLINNGRDGLIDNKEDTEQLIALNNDLNDAYNDLLIADKYKIIEASIPSEFFDVATDIEKIVEEYLEDETKQAEVDKKMLIAVASVVSKFMQAYISKDAGSMKAYLTKSAESVFNPGILDSPTEIKEFEITNKVKSDDDRAEIKVEISEETPDQSITTSRRKFVMVKENNQWLIDSWNLF